MVPESWETAQIQAGIRFLGKHGDFLIIHTPYSRTDMDSFADQFLDSEKTYAEKERLSTSRKLKSTGNLGRAFRRVLFFENGIGNVSLI
ncbi:MAG: hypothetical protein MK036_08295, partial [Dehalococcoidia bacterium]|nr:hypothetical protein [Dehalococcoidia bacterium]